MTSICIDIPAAHTETVATGLTWDRAHELALNIRRTVKRGERLFVTDGTRTTVIYAA